MRLVAKTSLLAACLQSDFIAAIDRGFASVGVGGTGLLWLFVFLQGSQVANPWLPMAGPGAPASPMKDSPVKTEGDVNDSGMGSGHGASRMVPAGPGEQQQTQLLVTV
jgi:hypothetical protein